MPAQIFTLAFAITVWLGGPVLAADAQGRFVVGGGVGTVRCPQFLNAMATARQKGGLNSPAGAWDTYGFAMYVSGFQTAFNNEANGIVDIFGDLGSDTSISALYAIEPWCAAHPDQKFVDGLLVLAATLRANAVKK